MGDACDAVELLGQRLGDGGDLPALVGELRTTGLPVEQAKPQRAFKCLEPP
jgi:hypothetical protein